MSMDGARDRIHDVVRSWDGVTTHSHRFGGTEWRYGRREIGHIHGDSLVDIPFPRGIRDDLVATGRARPHHWLPHSGWVSVPLNDDADLGWAVVLLRRSLDLAVEQARRRGARRVA